MTQKDKKITIATDEDVAQYAPAKVPAAAQDAPDRAEEQDIDSAKWHDRYLRAKADLQNLQRRSEEQRRTDVRFANAQFAKALLEVVDDFDRTLEAVESEAANNALVQGIRLTYDKLLQVLRVHGVTEIEALHKLFDPNCHEALMQQVDDQYPPNTVVQVAQKGYALHDRVLRPARVVIAKASDE